MRRESLLVACVALLALLAGRAPGQSSPPDSSQISKEFVLGKGIARDLGPRDGNIGDSAIIAYVQAIQDQLARAAGAIPLQVRISQGSEIYASRLSNGEIY